MRWRPVPLLIVALAFMSSACGDSRTEAAPAATLPAEIVAETTPAAAAATAAATTTAAPVATAAPTTTAATPPTVTTAPAPTTTLEPLPVPAEPPPPRSKEPYVELATMEVPALSIVTPLLEGISLNTLDLGPGHWPGTALPGQLGNVVIGGHRTSHGKIFRNIDRLVPGDEVIFTTADQRFVYAVTETTIVTPDAMYIVDQTRAHTATLFACHPVGSTRERIVVHLELQPDAATGSP